MPFVGNRSRCRIAFIKWRIMRIVEYNIIGNILIPLKLKWIFYDFDGNINHRNYLSNHILTHGFGGIRIPLVAFSIFFDSIFPLVDDFCLINGLLKHLVGVILDLFCWCFDNFLFSLFNNILVCSEIWSEFLFNHFSWL